MQPHRSRVPAITVENAFRPGRYRFSLVVVDDARNESDPTVLTVVVAERAGPVIRDPSIIRDGIFVRDPVIRRPIPVNPLRPGRPR